MVRYISIASGLHANAWKRSAMVVSTAAMGTDAVGMANARLGNCSSQRAFTAAANSVFLSLKWL
jgi:hypothetical protein